ncbi:hypothetical protein Y1Q_0004610 [Alligator mississippiensis]|uniref:DDE Tnp4 domain-containing protein n=1 Tax=Alligator mississippiensis TaxID=8496 RepID=A0A151MHN6_ALLMI|nr:hypothetical protein Y1Q_0004610 [Alligator mississippiensis]
MNIYVSCTGSTTDAQIFRNSTLAALVESGRFAPTVPDLQLGDVTILPHLIWNSMYPPLLWLMHPYTGHLNQSHVRFNWYLAQSSFRSLKGCWCTFTAHLKFTEPSSQPAHCTTSVRPGENSSTRPGWRKHDKGFWQQECELWCQCRWASSPEDLGEPRTQQWQPGHGVHNVVTDHLLHQPPQ